MSPYSAGSAHQPEEEGRVRDLVQHRGPGRQEAILDPEAEPGIQYAVTGPRFARPDGHVVRRVPLGYPVAGLELRLGHKKGAVPLAPLPSWLLLGQPVNVTLAVTARAGAAAAAAETPTSAGGVAT